MISPAACPVCGDTRARVFVRDASVGDLVCRRCKLNVVLPGGAPPIPFVPSTYPTVPAVEQAFSRQSFTPRPAL